MMSIFDEITLYIILFNIIIIQYKEYIYKYIHIIELKKFIGRIDFCLCFSFDFAQAKYCTF